MSSEKLRTEHVHELYLKNDSSASRFPGLSLWRYTFLSLLMVVVISFKIQSNLGSRTPRIMNSSVYEQIFRTQSVSDDVLCLGLRTRKPSTSWSDKLGVLASAVQKANMEEMSSEEEEGRMFLLLWSVIFVQNGVRCKVSWNDITPIKQ